MNSQWQGGFNAGITIQNTGAAPISSWALTWTWPSTQQVLQAWDGSSVQTGASVTLTNASWNGTIPAGGSQTGIGFTGSYSTANPAPTAFSLNGVQCR